MTDHRTCTRCGSPLVSAGDAALCPVCLIKAALEDSTADRERLAPPLIPGYTILDLLGEGGMGVVYLAEQEAPLRRRVALKLIKPGMNSRRVVARFETERQALARMDHPNIAAVFDAGTSPEGRPYFVMEFVAGVPITEYCDRHRSSTRERLERFVDVCAAVQHAHQKGVIHRDLKPSNVLVSEDHGRPRPKVIDFGIAKAIEPPAGDAVALTEHDTLVGTPEYMSPEQAALSPDIDTTTDVYSLGVLLYELLVGALPFDSKRFQDAGHEDRRRMIRDQTPTRPSARLGEDRETAQPIAAARSSDVGTLTRQLAGDLDWIVLRALEKERSRRYPAVAALAADVERFLVDKPVEARPPSVAYRVGKFVRRYRGPVLATTALAFALLGGLLISMTQYARADRARVEADRQRAFADANRAAAEAAARDADVQRNAAVSATAEADRQRVEAVRNAASAIESQREADYRAYLATISAADAESRLGLTDQARDRLLATPLELRGWEWRHLMLATDSSLFTRTFDRACQENLSPSNYDSALTLQNGGATIALRRCATLDLWTTGNDTRHTYQTNSGILAIDPAGEVVTVDFNGSAPDRWTLNRVTPGTNRIDGHVGPFDTQPRCAAFSSDGARLAIGLGAPYAPYGSPGEMLNDNVFEIWDTRTSRRIVRVLPGKRPRYDPRLYDPRQRPAGCLVAFSPDSTLLASSSATVHVWRADTGADVTSDATLCGSVPQPIAFSTDGRRLAVGRRTGLVDVVSLVGTGQIDHLDGNEFIRVRPLPDAYTDFGPERNEVLAIAFSPDGRRIVTGTDHTVGVWDVAVGKLIQQLSGHAARIAGVAVAPDGYIVSADNTGTIKMWPADLRSAATILHGSFGVPSTNVTLSRDGSVAVLVEFDGGVIAWGLAELSQLVLRPGSPRGVDVPHKTRSVAISADGHQLLTADGDEVGTVHDIVLPSGEQKLLAMNAQLEPGCERFGGPGGGLINPQFKPVLRMALSPDRRSVAFSQGLDCVIVRDIQTMKIQAILHENATDFAFRPDGLLMVVSSPKDDPAANVSRGSDPARVRIWDWRHDVFRRTLPVPVVGSNTQTGTWRFAMSSDGHRVALFDSNLSNSQTVSLWNSELTQSLGQFAVPARTATVSLSPDGLRVATTTYGAAEIRIWDAERRQMVLVLSDDDQHAGSAVFTPDGRLVVARASGGLTIWETNKPRCSFCPASHRD
jgi:serine/threonine protein kinase/WD40 repeat protein